jgi:hypothetical protein
MVGVPSPGLDGVPCRRVARCLVLRTERQLRLTTEAVDAQNRCLSMLSEAKYGLHIITGFFVKKAANLIGPI